MYKFIKKLIELFLKINSQIYYSQSINIKIQIYTNAEVAFSKIVTVAQVLRHSLSHEEIAREKEPKARGLYRLTVRIRQGKVLEERVRAVDQEVRREFDL